MNKKILLTLAIIVVAGVLAVYKARWDEQTQTENIKKFLDFQTQILNKNIEEEKLSAMTVATLLAQNEHVKKCMSQNNRQMCLETLGEFTKTLSKVPIYENTKFHIHTPEMRSFARSWIPLYNDDLTSFRHLLAEAKNGVEYGVRSELGKGSVFTYKFSPYSKSLLD